MVVGERTPGSHRRKNFAGIVYYHDPQFSSQVLKVFLLKERIEGSLSAGRPRELLSATAYNDHLFLLCTRKKNELAV